jgi:glycosyltransferase involved in cell wall biosynthesis
MQNELEKRLDNKTCEEDDCLKVSAVVPAYNEGKRILPVLEALKQASLVDEIIVVDDGSKDDTAEVAKSVPGVRVIKLEQNVGKGGAMRIGVKNTDADITVFLDADLIGITGELVDSIVKPVIEGKTDMNVGVFRGGRRITDLAQILTPFISGQRALRRETFLQMPEADGVRSGIEVALSKYFRAKGLKISTVTLSGCTHVMKEEKMGCVRGIAARLKMYYEIGRILLDGRTIIRQAANRQKVR